MKTYELEYEFMPLATVEIDEEAAAAAIKDMVDFWSEGELRLQKNGGDYTRAFLKQLGHHILTHGQPPEPGAEGWYVLDGRHGVKLIDWSPREDPDEDEIEIL